MKINIVSSVFCPEPIVSSRTSTDLAEQLGRNGNHVLVITAFPNRPLGKIYEGYKRKLWQYDHSFTGYEVLRCFSLTSSKSSIFSRFLENFSFGISSGLAVLFLERPDVIYGNTWPIFAQGILALVCRIRGIPLVMSVQDIYPESLFAQKRIGNRNSWLFRFLRWIDTKIKQSSKSIVVISEQFRQVYVQDRGISTKDVHLVPNWIDENQVQVNSNGYLIRRSHDIPEDAFLVVYAGNVGVASGMDTVIRAFQYLTTSSNIYLLVAGSGSKLSDWRELAGEMGNPRILFHTPWLDSETSSVLDAASLFILPTQNNQSLVSVPSKLIAYMLAGRPILCSAGEKSDIANIIDEAACGWIIPTDSPEVISQRILSLSQQPPDELRKFGERGKSYALKNMTKTVNLPKLVNLIQSTQ